MRTKALSLIPAFGLLFSILAIPNVIAAPVADCRIATSLNQTVSLGFPIAPERLKDKAKPKVLVLPYRLSDRPTFTFGEEVKADYFAAADQINRFSAGKSKPEIVFSEVIDIPDTIADMVQMRKTQHLMNSQRDESKSTWGFVRRVIALSDSKIDFTGIDGVLLHGSSTSSESWIAEAMMFSLNPRNPYFRAINTAENQLLNAVLLDKRTSIATITHEIMHLYGLTDLYGTPTGPNELSLMASNADNLLSYEKWILGWLPDNQVQCLDEKSEIDQAKINTRISIPNLSTDQLVVINTGQPGKAYVIETTMSRGNKYLAFYSLDNEARPPINMHSPVLGRPNDGISISKFSGVGVQLIAPQYSLLVSDMTATEIVLDLLPKNQVINAKDLISAAELNRSQIEQATRANQSIEPVQIKPIKTKKKSIICTKGKTIKKVVAVKPKCPTGFIAKK